MNPDFQGGDSSAVVRQIKGLRDGSLVEAPTRDAATVVLLRDSADGPEAYLLRRVRAMAFAGGAHVFPGGSVDPEDKHVPAEMGWSGPAPDWWAERLRCDVPTARALVCAAVRETFEESGVLLAGPSEHEVLADVSSDDWEAERVALEAREQSLSDLLARRSLVLRADLLRPYAHWVTPVMEPKRFDTRFFLAALPTGQVCRDAGTEADQRVWARPVDALASDWFLMPPTRVSLDDLLEDRDVAAALDAEREIRSVSPVYDLDEDDNVVLLPDGATPSWRRT